jgi:hypothetical protein
MSELGLAAYQAFGGKTLEEQRVLDFMCAAKDAALESKRCEMRLQETWAECQRITAQLGGMPGGGSGDVHKDSVWIAYTELREVLKEAYQRAKALERRAEMLLQKLPDATDRAVLSLHYMQNLRWPRVQEELKKIGIFYEERNIYNIHDRAIRHAAELWSEEEVTLCK